MALVNPSTSVDFNLLNDYYEAYYSACLNDDEPMKTFKRDHAKEFSYFSSVHHKRSKVRTNLDVLASYSNEVYFGTLTFKNSKNKNTIRYKRSEAFKVLNRLFFAFMLVEELGELNGRYHIHFVGVFKKGLGFADFIKAWHSRQNIEKVEDVKEVSQYLVKYVSKSLPRIRRNKSLISLEKAYKGAKRLERARFSYTTVESFLRDSYNVVASD